MVGEGQFDAGLAEAYRMRYFQPRRQEAKAILEKGIRRGELNSTLDVGLGVDLLYGPIFYRLLVTGEPLDDDYVRQLVKSGFEGIRARQGKGTGTGGASGCKRTLACRPCSAR